MAWIYCAGWFTHVCLVYVNMGAGITEKVGANEKNVNMSVIVLTES